MSTQSMVDSYREGAEIFTGREVCKQKANELHDELHLPRGLLPLTELTEVGYNREAGFVWFRQERAIRHKFKKIGEVTSFAAEVTAFVEDRRMSRLTGVKSRELLLWLPVSEFFIDVKDPEKITFKSRVGVSKSFPVSAFDEEEAVDEVASEEGEADAEEGAEAEAGAVEVK